MTVPSSLVEVLKSRDAHLVAEEGLLDLESGDCLLQD